MSTVKVWGLGDAVVDLLPEKPGTLLQCPGGAPANVAVGVARLGGLSGFVGCVGDDPFGRFMRKTLADEGVDTAYTHSQLINSIDILRARRATGLMTRDNYRTVNNITLGKHPGAKQ
ncbi:hypothetical protein EBP73_04915 [Escherichia coli O5]|nr:hypothetical protein [Escherichia coli O5]